MLTLTTSPANYQLARNPVYAEITTNNHVATAGVKASRKFSVSSTGATATQTIKVEWGDVEIIMTFAAALDNTGLKLRVAGALSLANFILQIADDLKTNYDISTYFDITTDVTGVILTAKESGTFFNLTYTITATGITSSTNVAGVDEILNENFKILMEVHAEEIYESGAFTKQITEEIEPTNNISQFNLKRVLSALFTEIDLPLYGQNGIVKCEHFVRNYYIRYAEKYGNPATVKQITKGTTNLVLRGGVSHEENSLLGFSLIENFINNAKMFLTFQPRSKKVTKTQQEFLYWVVPSGVTSIVVKRKRYFDDGTSDTANASTKAGITANQVYVIPAGYTAVAAAHVTKKVLKYELWVIDQVSNVVSEIFTFKIDEKPAVDNHYFLFENQFGGLDTLRTTGDHFKGVQIGKESFKKIVSKGYAINKHHMGDHYFSKTDVMRCSTGWKTRAEINWIEQMFVSSHVWEEVNGEFIPVRIITSEFQKHNTDASLFAILFEYEFAYASEFVRGTLEAPTGGGDAS